MLMLDRANPSVLSYARVAADGDDGHRVAQHVGAAAERCGSALRRRACAARTCGRCCRAPVRPDGGAAAGPVTLPPFGAWMASVRLGVNGDRAHMMSDFSLAVQGGLRVSARLRAAGDARACYVLAHGAGAGMDQPFMSAVAASSARAALRHCATSFPTWSGVRGGPIRRRCATRRCAPRSRRRRTAPRVPAAHRRGPLLRRPHDLAGAGARATARGARTRLPRFPVAPGRTTLRPRAEHLARVRIPLLFVQGARDALAERARSRRWCRGSDACHRELAGGCRSRLSCTSAQRPQRCGSEKHGARVAVTQWLDGLL